MDYVSLSCWQNWKKISSINLEEDLRQTEFVTEGWRMEEILIVSIRKKIENICNTWKNKHFEPVLVCCGFFLTVR